MLGGIFILIGLGIYFLPTIWAEKTHHKSKSGILLLNLFLGWTLIGWVVALVWANQNNPLETEDKNMKKCPQCAEFVKKEAIKCRFCGHEFK